MSIEQLQPNPLESSPHQESVEGLRALFEEAEKTLGSSWRPRGKSLLARDLLGLASAEQVRYVGLEKDLGLESRGRFERGRF